MKKIISIAIIVLALVLSGCGVPTKSEVAQKSSKVEVKGERPTIHFLGQASYENDMNIVKDQLENAGFNVKMNIQQIMVAIVHNVKPAIMISKSMTG